MIAEPRISLGNPSITTHEGDSSKLSISVFGGVEVTLGKQDVRLRNRKARALRRCGP
jgi:predicted component of type VI protein secretion system